MLKATSEILSKYDLIKDFIINKMKRTPNLQALSAFQFLTGARIHECIPYKEKKLALFTFNLSIQEIDKNIWAITLPYVLKTKQTGRGKSRKAKEMTDTRTIYTNDAELMEILNNYLAEDLPNWRGELLERSFFNPNKVAEFNFLQSIMGTKQFEFSRYMKSRLRTWKAFRKNYAWLFENKKGNKPLYQYLIFPFTYSTIQKAYRRHKYNISGLLWNTETGSFVESERPLYTHMWREGIVNSMLFDFGLIHDEVVRVMGWKERQSIEYYIRRGEQIDQSIIEKLKTLNKLKEEMKEKEENKKQKRIVR